MKRAGVIESVAIDKDGKLDIKLNENFCGTIDFCGDLTSYKRNPKKRERSYRTGKFEIERPFGNEIIIDVFEELLNKIKKHNSYKNKEKQIQFVAVPGNHEFLGFQGNEDNLAVVGGYEKFKIDPVNGMQALKTKLRGVKVIADIQKYFFEQVKNNGEEKDIVDDDYGDSIDNIDEKIKKLDEESKQIEGLIEVINKKKTEEINKDIEILIRSMRTRRYPKNIVDLKLSKLNVLQWNKSNLLSKIVFCHNGKKIRTLHSFAFFAEPGAGDENDVFVADDKKITADNQKKHFGKNLNQNIVNTDGVGNKSFPCKKVFKNNKISTFVGHEGTRYVKDQTEKVFCVDEQYYKTGAVLFIVDNNCIQGYDIKTGKTIKDEVMKIDTYDVKKEKMSVKIQRNIRRHLARKKHQAKKKNAVKIQRNICKYLAKKKYGDSLVEHYFEQTNGVDNFKRTQFQEAFCKHFGGKQNDWFGFLSKDDDKQELVVDKKQKKIKNRNKIINRNRQTSLKK